MKTNVTINWGEKVFTCDMNPDERLDRMFEGEIKELELSLLWDEKIDMWQCVVDGKTCCHGASRRGNSAQEAVDNLHEFLQEECLYLQNLVNPK